MLGGTLHEAGRGEKGAFPESLTLGSYWVSGLTRIFLTSKVMWVSRCTVLLIVVMDVKAPSRKAGVGSCLRARGRSGKVFSSGGECQD